MRTPKPNLAPRLAASHFAKYVGGIIGLAVRKHNISLVDVAILTLLFSESTAPLRDEPYLANRFGFEERGLPNEYRPVVSLKFIHNSLGLSRETARRKLERLVERGFITKTTGGYMLHHQQGEDDFLSDFRFSLIKSLEFIVSEASRPRPSD